MINKIIKFKQFFRTKKLPNKSELEIEVEVYLAQNKMKKGKLEQIVRLAKMEEFNDILDILWIKTKIRNGNFEEQNAKLRNFLNILEKKLK